MLNSCSSCPLSVRPPFRYPADFFISNQSAQFFCKLSVFPVEEIKKKIRNPLFPAFRAPSENIPKRIHLFIYVQIPLIKLFCSHICRLKDHMGRIVMGQILIQSEHKAGVDHNASGMKSFYQSFIFSACILSLMHFCKGFFVQAFKAAGYSPYQAVTDTCFYPAGSIFSNGKSASNPFLSNQILLPD